MIKNIIKKYYVIDKIDAKIRGLDRKSQNLI